MKGLEPASSRAFTDSKSPDWAANMRGVLPPMVRESLLMSGTRRRSITFWDLREEQAKCKAVRP